MKSKELLKSIIVDNQNRRVQKLWKRTQSIPIDSGKIITLTGVRRSGKTYHLLNLINQLINDGISQERILFINFEDERLKFAPDEFDLILQSYQELYPSLQHSDCFFFFDEVHEAPGWEKFIQRIHATISKNVFITGSNSRLLSQEIATVMRGRTLTFEVYPFSFSEYVHALFPGVNPHRTADQSALISYFTKFMHQGGFPELFTLEDLYKEKLLQEYFNTMLFRDLIERYQISNITVLRYFCKQLIANSASEFSVNKIFNDLKSQGYKVGKDSLYAFQNQVESVYLARFINKWSASSMKSEKSLKKCYVIDSGLGAALDYKYSQDLGRLFETTVALELCKQGKIVTYQQNGWECDFLIIEKGEPTIAIQAAIDISDEKTKEREIKGLLQTCLATGIKEGILLTLDQNEEFQKQEIHIRIEPAWRYFY